MQIQIFSSFDFKNKNIFFFLNNLQAYLSGGGGCTQQDEQEGSYLHTVTCMT